MCEEIAESVVVTIFYIVNFFSGCLFDNKSGFSPVWEFSTIILVLCILYFSVVTFSAQGGSWEGNLELSPDFSQHLY